MDDVIVYIHGQGGSAAEAERFRPLFPTCEVIGFDYRADTPWDAAEEFPRFFSETARGRKSVRIIANSIGAYFAMHALGDFPLAHAYFIFPVADMETLIRNMMQWADVSEEELCGRGEIATDFGQTLSWEYLTYVCAHPLSWHTPTHILYAAGDTLISRDAVSSLAARTGAHLTVMAGGEHWFHTPEQMAFLDRWLKQNS